MKTLLVSALALGALTSAALAAEPLRLSDAQMDAVTAGAGTFEFETANMTRFIVTGDFETGGSAAGSSSQNHTVEFNVEFTSPPPPPPPPTGG